MSLKDKIDQQIEEVATRVVEIVATRQNMVTSNQNGAGRLQSFFTDDQGNRKAKVVNQYGQVQEVSLIADRPLGKGDTVIIQNGFAR
jgi:hypothetical protein